MLDDVPKLADFLILGKKPKFLGGNYEAPNSIFENLAKSVSRKCFEEATNQFSFNSDQ